MRLLVSYLLRYKRLILAALGLTAINQVFSLLDPQVFRLIVDRYAVKATQLPAGVFVRGVLLLLLAYVGVARVAHREELPGLLRQRHRPAHRRAALRAQRVALVFAPYAVFEDQRSGEILQKMHKARADAQ
jgi:ATP-binding cassette subfamily B protein